MTEKLLNKGKRYQGFFVVKAVIAYVVLLALIIGVGTIVTRRLSIQVYQQVMREGKASLFALASNVNRLIEETDRVARIYAGSPGVLSAFQDDSTEEFMEINAVLDRYAFNMGSSVFYLLDQQGTTVATSNRHSDDSFLEKNYQFRPYFQQALQGSQGRYFAVGVTSGKRGYYSSYPVYNEKKEIMGVAVIKKQLEEIEQAFFQFDHGFLINAKGAIFLSSDPSLTKHVLWDVAQNDSDQHDEDFLKKDENFLSLGIKSQEIGRVLVFNDKPVVFQQRKIVVPGWSVVLLSPASRGRVYVLFGAVVTIFLCFILTAFAVFLYLTNLNANNTRLLASIVEFSQYAIISTSLKGAITSWNKGGEKIYGYSSKEIIGKSMGSIFEDNEKQKLNDILETVKGGRSVERLETIHRHQQGRSVDIALTASPIYDRKKRIIGVSVISRDISQEKQIEERIRQAQLKLLSIFDNIDEVVYVSDPDTYELLYFNNAFQRNWPARIGEKCFQAIHGAGEPCVFCTNKEIFGENLGKTYTWEKQNTINSRWYRLIDKAIPWPNGKNVRYEMAIDITEQKKAQEEIRKTKEYLDMIFSLTPSAIFTIDPDRRITKWNKKAEELTGFSEQEAIGQECLFFADEPCRTQCGLYCQDVLKPIANKECTIKRKDGQIRYILKNADVLKNNKGEVIGGIESFEDITEQKKAIKALAESEEKYRYLVENANSIILRIDNQGNVVFFNEYAEKFFGFTKEEVIGRHVIETIVPKEDSRGFCMSDIIQQIIENPTAYGVNENENICKDGKRVWVRWANKVVYNEQTDKAELLSVGTDITESKNFQDELIKLSRAVEQSPSTVVITDPQGNIEYVNPKFCQLTGYTAQEAMGKNPRILKSDKQPAEFYKEMWETILRGEEWRGEFCNKKKNGDLYWEYASISPIRDDQGNTVRFVAVKEDVTARKIAEEKAQEAMRLKSEFISVVSHELRTPLTAIKEGISIVADGVTGEINKDQAEFLSVAKRNVDRLSRLINDVLDFQKLDVHQMNFDFVHQDIRPVVREVIATMAQMAQAGHTELSLDCSDHLSWATFDRDRITQVITNLVSNAVKYAPGKPVTVRVREEDKILKVSVIDQGEGIKEEDFSKLFQTFSQLKQGKERKTGSTGLGLAICKKIIEDHGGKIWVESTLSQGSTFSFIIPLDRAR